MSSNRRYGALVGLACAFAIAVAADSPPEHPEALVRLLGPVVGHSYVASFPGGKMTDTQSFEWMLDGRFVRNTHFVSDSEGKRVYEGETVYAVDAATGGVVWWYWNTTGGYIVGTLTEDVGRVLIEGENHAPPNQPRRVRGVWSEISSEGFVATQLFEVEGEWRERFTMRFAPVTAPGSSS